MITFCCLKAGKAYGPEYVNNLAGMISRNLKQDFKLVCLTDDPTGLDERIDTLPLPAELEKWWGKLYFFKRGVFPEGERVIYLDLDTLIVGSLDELVTYKGQFATLMDFYWPHLIGPAVIMWTVSDYTASVWEEWEACGNPRHDMGDLWWLNCLDQGRFHKRADKLQLLYPGVFVSFKVHCLEGEPQGAAVVCFHGKPKVTDLPANHWAFKHWKVAA